MDTHQPATLKRSVSLVLITFYGIGTILGAGIYALVGTIAKHAALSTPFAFLLASCLAFFTAISYAELSSRFPKSAGEAFYVQQAMRRKWLSGLIGWLVVLTGIISSGTLTRAFVGYLQIFIPLPTWLTTTLLVVMLGSIAIWGIIESTIISMIIAIIEIIGLLLIVTVAGSSLHQLPTVWHQMLPTLELSTWLGIFSGAFIAFYAYIGFEDMVNIAEEVKNPEKNLPYAIFISLGIVTILYFIVSLVIVLALPLDDLVNTEAPLAAVFIHKGHSPLLISAISMIAIINGALVQIIMASRVIYGMAAQKNAPRIFTSIHPTTQTPIFATLLVAIVILLLALYFPIEALAKTTSAIVLCVFTMIHLSLIIIKKRKLPASPNIFTCAIGFPIIGAILSICFLAIQLFAM